MPNVSRRIDAIVQIDRDEWLVLEDPVRVVEALRTEDVATALAAVDELTRGRGCYAVGFVSYEAAAAYGPDVNQNRGGLPLAQGDSYQVNYTFRIEVSFRGDPRSLFADLAAGGAATRLRFCVPAGGCAC